MPYPHPSSSSTAAVVRAGFIPLTDCAALAVTRECGFDHRHGFRLELSREPSWANIRDKVNVGLLDCAHMLAPMPIASSLGIGHVRVPLIVPVALGLNGNAITVSQALYAHMADLDAGAVQAGGMAAAQALAAVLRERRQQGLAPLTFGMVFPFSCHNYELRHWLATAGIDPDRDVQLVVIPPPLMADSLRAGHIHGFCVGEPWSSLAVEQGAGCIAATKAELWNKSPEKVLGVSLAWAEQHPELLMALIRALTDAARWLDAPGSRAEAATLLSAPAYLGLPPPMIARALEGRMLRAKGAAERRDTDFIVFHRYHATYPWRSHAIWMMAEMIRWGQVAEPFDLRAAAERIYRPDLYRTALAGTGRPMPESDMAPGVDGPFQGGFFGDGRFEPRRAIDYLRGQTIRSPAVDLDAFERVNGDGGDEELGA